jgi:hypothetical protein
LIAGNLSGMTGGEELLDGIVGSGIEAGAIGTETWFSASLVTQTD